MSIVEFTNCCWIVCDICDCTVSPDINGNFPVDWKRIDGSKKEEPKHVCPGCCEKLLAKALGRE